MYATNMEIVMHLARSTIVLLLAAHVIPAYAVDADIRVIVSSDVRPGLYGRVEIGSAPPPPVVYARPMLIIQQPPSVQVQPVYLHVPPGHAKNWRKHCREYNACGMPVYFVKSKEYEPKGKKEKKEKKHD